MSRRNAFRAALFAAAAVLFAGSPAQASAIVFNAQDVVDAMSSAGAPLNSATMQWGVWAVRVMPVVSGGGYTITGGSTTQTGWGVAAPNGAFGAAPYSASNSAWFYDYSGSEAGLAANPLYMIMTVPAANFCSYTFNGSAAYVGAWSPGGTGCGSQIFQPSGYDGGAGGTNVVIAVDPASMFTVNFTLDPGATWDGQYMFVVDGSRYSLGTGANPGQWNEDFFGGYGDSGGLAGNSGVGFSAVVPEPATLALFGSFVLAGAWVARRRLRRTVKA